MKKEDFKELDDLIEYLENELIPSGDKDLIHDGICRYAELWHSKMIKSIKENEFIGNHSEYTHVNKFSGFEEPKPFNRFS